MDSAMVIPLSVPDLPIMEGGHASRRFATRPTSARRGHIDLDPNTGSGADWPTSMRPAHRRSFV